MKESHEEVSKELEFQVTKVYPKIVDRERFEQSGTEEQYRAKEVEVCSYGGERWAERRETPAYLETPPSILRIVKRKNGANFQDFFYFQHSHTYKVFLLQIPKQLSPCPFSLFKPF